jgi:hypothetical protein
MLHSKLEIQVMWGESYMVLRPHRLRKILHIFQEEKH